MTSSSKTRRLEPGSRMAVVGGGPAGSFFAICLLRLARERNLDIQVEIYEARNFAASGPLGCNRCAGILSASLLKNLRGLGISIPQEVVLGRITSYQLYSPYGTAEIKNPDPFDDIFSIYRGSGPLHSHGQQVASFDGFLLAQAQSLGARVLHQKAQEISLRPSPTVRSNDAQEEYDLVVLSSGLNSGTIPVEGLPYRPPATRSMAQDELYAAPEDIQRFFGASVKVFLLPGADLIFGTLVPKGHFINVSLLGAGETWRVEDFLSNDLVKEAIPFPYERSCGCRPKIAVGMASHFYADGFVAIGDACVARLYKDGIGSALLTARQAARTALDHGVSSEEFARHYAPLALAIHRDNRFGKAIFGVHHRIKESPALFRSHSRLIAAEQSQGKREQPFSRTFWGIFTGSYTYRQIAQTALKPSFIVKLATGYLREKLGLQPPALPCATLPEAAPSTPRRPRRILVLGGGFGGVYTTLHLERALRHHPGVSLTLVSDENFFLFTPMLQEVATGGIETRHIAYPIRRLRHRENVRFLQTRVLDIDLHERKVATGYGPLDYDLLVLALGSITDMTELPRPAKNVFTLKSLLDGMFLRNHVINALELADIEDDPYRRRQLLTFVVAGGGYTGIQLITEMCDFIRGSLLKEYKSIQASEVRILLMEGQERLLPGKDAGLARRIGDILGRQGIEIMVNSKVTDLQDGSMEINGEQWLPTGTVVWATGIRANPVVARLPVEKDSLGRVLVNEYLELPAFPGVYALGDNACIMDAATGEALPPRAHFAVRQPKTVAANILADLGGKARRPYRWKPAIEMISLGPRNAAMSFRGIHLFGLPVRLLWVLGYLSLVIGAYNRIRIVVDWLLILFFGRDSTLLRIERDESGLGETSKPRGGPP